MTSAWLPLFLLGCTILVMLGLLIADVREDEERQQGPRPEVSP